MFFPIALSFFTAVQATALLPTRQDITLLSQSQIDAFTPYTHFASAAYCNPTTTETWSCGANCAANAAFEPTFTGGDGDAVQFWFVGYNPPTGEVIVSYEGTGATAILAYLTDVDLFLTPLNMTSFPGTPAGIEVHSGFQDAHARSASNVLSAVEATLSKYATNQVTIVGHSLGSAIALLDSVYLPLHLPGGLTFKTFAYGLPRVGNPAFANYIDSNININLTHINNREDLFPILPGQSLGFAHPTGELHIQDDLSWENCPGQDNPSTLCIVGDVPTILQGNVVDHYGPYNGVEMAC